MSMERDTGDQMFVGRRGGEAHRMVSAEVLAAIPAARAAAERAGARLDIDFLDDDAVLRMLRLRHLDELAMFRAGAVHGVPLAFVGTGLFLYWAAYVRYWETARPQQIYLAAAAVVLGIQLILFVRSGVSVWRDRGRQNVRARAAAYREIAHIARHGGADIPAFYPHYGPYPFAATYRRGAKELELPPG